MRSHLKKALGETFGAARFKKNKQTDKQGEKKKKSTVNLPFNHRPPAPPASPRHIFLLTMSYLPGGVSASAKAGKKKKKSFEGLREKKKNPAPPFDESAPPPPMNNAELSTVSVTRRRQPGLDIQRLKPTGCPHFETNCWQTNCCDSRRRDLNVPDVSALTGETRRGSAARAST